ncbi:hypothetical protein AJ80_07479 [Polytolypa hystricis UAMH7299]|uniref:Probable beta-glucosidase E n=1 Tax=Polytolypa hystricis (strain UAMH7299) TaxID=1447883 RepID=A0A2B7XN08_POLH7|nr:hypothetical protein AJ80_07479 [Polytolypa hystricis UAMH7299]
MSKPVNDPSGSLPNQAASNTETSGIKNSPLATIRIISPESECEPPHKALDQAKSQTPHVDDVYHGEDISDEEETSFLHPSDEMTRSKLIPERPRRKTCRIILGLGGIIVAAAIVLAVLGATGKFEKKRESNIPKDGLSPPWYPTPKGGTVSKWAESYSKAQKLVEKMSLPEKVNVTTGVGWAMGLCVGNTGPATLTGFPSLCLQDGPLGLRFADNITAFPAGITVGATWSQDLMRKRGQALGKEARLKGVNVILGPSMGPIGTLPAGGRNWEGFGSDPVLQGIAAAETIRGIQENGVIATAKHYVLNEQEHFRKCFEWELPNDNAMSTNIDDRTLREVFIWPFAESVRAGVASVMCSYQLVNNSFACGNSLLMNGILKDELGFQGFVQSDWLAQRSGVASALAGLDVTMPGDGLHNSDGNSLWGGRLAQAVLNTSVPLERLNDMTTRVVAAWYQLKQDSWPKPPPEGDGGPNFSSWTNDRIGRIHQGSDDETAAVVNRYVRAQGEGKDAHKHLARQIAAEGTVLVKNVNGFLPLARTIASGAGKYRVGVFGEDAGPGRGPNACTDRSCNQGTLGSGWGSGAVDFPYLITPWKSLSTAFNNDTVTVSGYLNNNVRDEDIHNSSLCIVFANSDAGEGYLRYEDIRGDRNDLFLQKDGGNLVQNVATRCGNGTGSTVVVVHAVGPVILEPWVELPGVKAVLLANLPGQESGDALVDVLFGDVDVSGRLPYTMGKKLEDYGPEAGVLYQSSDPVPQKNFSHGMYLDYRYFDKHNITPRYEFGFGLSYTTFELSNLRITRLREKTPLPSPRPSSPDVSPPSYSTKIPSPESALFPKGFRKLKKYVYPYISSIDEIKQGKYQYPDGYDKLQPPSQAGGGEGGNPSLFESVLNVNVTIRNTGSRTGKQVAQLYVSFPDNVVDTGNTTSSKDGEKTEDVKTDPADTIDFPVRVLRNFQKVELHAGQSVTVSMSLTRKDLSFWSTRRQNWVMPVEGKFKISVGRSSRDLPLVGEF